MPNDGEYDSVQLCDDLVAIPLIPTPRLLTLVKMASSSKTMMAQHTWMVTVSTVTWSFLLLVHILSAVEDLVVDPWVVRGNQVLLLFTFYWSM